MLSKVVFHPIDPIFGLTRIFNDDKSSNKINLIMGSYRDDEGKNYVFDVVKKAYEQMKPTNFEYRPLIGNIKLNET